MNARVHESEPRWRERLLLNENLNFLLTNRIPRRLLTHFMGWYSRLRSPTLTRISIGIWRLFTELDLSEAREQRFNSLQACFTRELREGARPLDPDPATLISPVDAQVGACGRVQAGLVLQAKGMPYRMAELLGSDDEAQAFEGGHYLTLRLTSAMYHRFHAPDDACLEQLRYLSGDTWNVNPIALKRIERLFCRNERAPMRLRLDDGTPLMLVPVAAILVASIRLHALGTGSSPRQLGSAPVALGRRVQRGEELGWFEHGSTVIVLAPPGLLPCVQEGELVRMGQALLRRTVTAASSAPRSMAGHAT